MKAVAFALGADGEVRPFLGICAALRRRGHDVCFVSSDNYQQPAIQAGMEFRRVEGFDHNALLAEAGIFGDDRKDREELYKTLYYPYIDTIYETIVDALTTPRADILLASDATARAAAETLGTPWIPAVLTPARLRSRYDPVHPERILPSWAALLARSAGGLSLLHILNRARRGQLAPPERRVSSTYDPSHPVVRLRERLQLAPLGSDEAASYPPCVLGLWPEWFGPRQRDWPEQMTLTGFPKYWESKSNGVEQSAFTNGDKKPIVATTGSLASGQFEFYSKIVAACRETGWPAVLVSPHDDHIPSGLPANVSHERYAPFSELFAGASLVIHHGGVGTAVHALQAGIPQLITPMRGEQFDIGNRLGRLGVGKMHSLQQLSESQLTGAMRKMMSASRIALRCEKWKAVAKSVDGFSKAADIVEKAVSSAR